MMKGAGRRGDLRGDVRFGPCRPLARRRRGPRAAPADSPGSRASRGWLAGRRAAAPGAAARLRGSGAGRPCSRLASLPRRRRWRAGKGRRAEGAGTASCGSLAGRELDASTSLRFLRRAFERQAKVLEGTTSSPAFRGGPASTLATPQRLCARRDSPGRNLDDEAKGLGLAPPSSSRRLRPLR